MASLSQEAQPIDSLLAAQLKAAARTPDGQLKAPTWTQKIASQGPWDEINDLLPLEGPPALPMPVKISDEESLKPFFKHLESNTVFEHDGDKREPFYDTDMLEFNKGVVYVDGRMDLCKMVVGPSHIGDLMKSLESNDHVKHFLLGNNIIGPAGARAIAQFSSKLPDRMETWYLAGNCIDTAGLHLMVEPFCKSTVMHSLWLKRNPLGPSSAADFYQLISSIPSLRTLDLDLTELGDEGTSHLFALLTKHVNDTTSSPLGLRNIYLNGNGIGSKAAESISGFLASPRCLLESLFLSCNPIGDKGAISLSKGLETNTSLLRLTLASCGLKNAGGKSILQSLSSHPTIQALNLGHSFATQDLNQRYNWFEDGLEADVIHLIEQRPTLRLLNLGYTALTHPTIEIIASSIPKSNLLSYVVDSVYPAVKRPERPRIKREITATLERNVKEVYSPDMSLTEFNDGPLRFLRNTPDVRFIDSVYRNRDMQKARRKLMMLDKWWDEDDETLRSVAASRAERDL